MTKAEQARLTAWRFTVIQRASEGSRNVAQTCRHFGLSRQAFYKMEKRGSRSTGRPGSVTGRGRHIVRRDRLPRRSSVRSCTCAKPTILDRARLPTS